MFNAFMTTADLSFGVLGTELWSPAGLGLGRQALRRFGRRGLRGYVGGVLTSCRDWLDDTFEADAAHGLLAPWVLHTGLGPDQATSGFMTQVIACALQLGGMPVPKGGGRVLVDGLAGIVRDAGGEVRSGVEVERGGSYRWTCHRCPAGRRRDDPRRAGGRRRHHADSALRCSSSEREDVPDAGRAARPSAFATAAARCRFTSR